MQPNITLVILLNQKSDISSIKFDDEIIAWAANENSKTGLKPIQICGN